MKYRFVGSKLGLTGDIAYAYWVIGSVLILQQRYRRGL
jgi:hypothetical protein